MLKVQRTQLPLIPGYAMTAHASEGKTLPAVLLDLQVDKRVDPTIGTVATTRVRSRDDVLILRPFPRWLFQRGMASEGPDLLLKKLRGEAIDWATIREATRPCSTCKECQQVLPMDAFEQKQMGARPGKQNRHVQNLQGRRDPEASAQGGRGRPREARVLRMQHDKDRRSFPTGTIGPRWRAGAAMLLEVLPGTEGSDAMPALLGHQGIPRIRAGDDHHANVGHPLHSLSRTSSTASRSQSHRLLLLHDLLQSLPQRSRHGPEKRPAMLELRYPRHMEEG